MLPPSHFLRHVAVWVYIIGYFSLLALLYYREHFSPTEPLLVLLVVGGLFSLLAVWLTRGRKAHSFPVNHPRAESRLLVGYLFVIVAFLTWGIPFLRTLGSTQFSSSLALLTGKLLVFVVVPLILWKFLWGYTPACLLGLPIRLKGHWRPVLGMAGVLIVFQLVFGRALKALAETAHSPVVLGIASFLAFGWLLVEVGLVEEFFFRGLLQTRLAVWTGSECTAIVLVAVLFGLAHAPGLYLRPETTGEALGTAPSLIKAVGYAITVTSVTGFFLGVLWARLRNLAALIIIHTAGDFFPNLVDFVRMVSQHSR